MVSIRKNIIANLAGNAWQALTGVVFVPLYIKFLGMESWGVIGIFATLQIILGLLDVGLSSTLNREMARLSVLPQKEQEMRNLVRTLEVLYWGVAIIAGVAIVVLSPFIAHHWVKAGNLPTKTIEQSLFIMGFIIALQMPAGFYSGGLMGLQRQVSLNVISIAMSTVRCAGTVLILWLVSPTIQAFFLWQIIVSMIHTCFLALFFWSNLPLADSKAVFQKSLLKGIWRFTVGVGGIAVLSVILTQLDKVILSKLLPLEMFGYYVLASMVGMSLSRLFGPMFCGVYPRLTQLVSSGDQVELKRLYHRSCQFMAVLILPAATVVALFSYEILVLWTQDTMMAEKAYLLVSILICGTALNGLMNFPYALQLAFGWTKLSVIKNIIAVVLLVPAMVYMAERYGAIGAASVWLILNFSYIIFEIPVMHRRLLPGEKWRWYRQGILYPLSVCMVTAGAGRFIFLESMPRWMQLLCLLLVFVFTYGAVIIATPPARERALRLFSRVKGGWKPGKEEIVKSM